MELRVGLIVGKKITAIKKINWHWVKGHSNNALNDLADNLAKNAIPN